MSKLLLVEDSEFFSGVIKRQVENDLHLSVACAQTLAETKDLIRAHCEDFFLALLDLTLPDAPNGEVVDYVCSAGIPTIVFTGSFDEDSRQKFEAKGVIDYVVKESPASLDYLISLVRRIHNNRKTTALVVDDSKTTRHMLSHLLTHYRFQVVEASGGQEALELLQAFPETKLVITDYHMPEMDGFELIKRVRKHHGRDHLAIIGISGSDNDALSAKFIKFGANDFLKKPFSREEFFCRINQNLDNLEMVEALQEAATKDFLTGMFNRRFFFEKAPGMIAAAIRRKQPASLAMLDIDFFKKINDRYGHETGDDVLKIIAGLLKRFIGEGEIAARFGGEEFCLLIPNRNMKRLIEDVESLRHQIENTTIQSGDHEIRVTVSIGICLDQNKSLHEMLASADHLLYKAKETGRNKAVFSST